MVTCGLTTRTTRRADARVSTGFMWLVEMSDVSKTRPFQYHPQLRQDPRK